MHIFNKAFRVLKNKGPLKFDGAGDCGGPKKKVSDNSENSFIPPLDTRRGRFKVGSESLLLAKHVHCGVCSGH